MKLDFSQHPHWPQVSLIIEKLNKSGHRAFIAGGAVRDGLIAQSPKDFDIATDADEQTLRQLFPKALSVGQQFGIFILAYKDFQIEVAGFRKEGEYQDGRRPSYVEPGTIEDDATRRDFTINALFYDPEAEQIIDLVGGQADIRDGVIRCVGHAQRRFEEDHLRVLRALRFAAQLDFEIEKETFAAVERCAEWVLKVSPERITQEWQRLLTEKKSHKALLLAEKSGLFALLFPELNGEKVCRTFLSSPQVSGTFALALMIKASLANASDQIEISQQQLSSFLQNSLSQLRLSNKELFEIQKALEIYQGLVSSEIRKGEYLALALKSHFPLEWLKFWKQHSLLKKPIEAVKKELEQIFNEKREHPYLSGADLKQRGFAPGPKMGEVLREAFLLQLEGQLKSREEALGWLKNQ